MFGQKSKSKLSVDLAPRDPVFYAQYMGKMEIASFRKRELMVTAIEMLVNRGMSINLGNLPRVSMTFNSFGIHMIDSSGGRPNHRYEFSFRLCDISYCLANRGMKRVFAWVVTDPDGIKRPRIHAVLCGKEEVARVMALLMTEYFNIAYKDHQTAKGRRNRQKKLNHRLEGQRMFNSFDETSYSAKQERTEVRRENSCNPEPLNVEAKVMRKPSQLFPPKARPRPRLPMLDPNAQGPSGWVPSSSSLPRSKSTSAADHMRTPERTSSFSQQLARERLLRQALPYDPETSDAKSIKDACNTLRRLKVDPAKLETSERSEVDSLFDWVDEELNLN